LLISYNFKNKKYLNEALTHSSLADTTGIKSNERLEFLGDSILGMVVADFLYKNLPSLPEGELTKIRASIVREQSLSEFAKKIKLDEKIKLAKGEEVAGGRAKKSILADAFEALVAAIYLDGGMRETKKFLLQFMPNPSTLKKANVERRDYKTILQELVQKNHRETVEYYLAEESGAPHEKTFTLQVKFKGKIIGTGTGTNKKRAGQMAAKDAIEKKIF